MIYVISSPAFKDDESFERLLKIGYTEDSKKDRRYYQYKAHNPTIKVLYEIPNGTLELENLIHSYFNKYKYGDFGKEWFIWDEEIIKFFETNKTVEDLLSILNLEFIRGCSKRRFNGFTKFSYDIIDKCLNLKLKLCDDFSLDQVLESRELCYRELDKSGLILEEGVIKFIVNYFDLTLDQYTEFINIKLPENILGFVEDFNNLSTFYDKMKALCESPFNNLERSIILEQIPITFKNYYNLLGPITLKACGYNITNIRKKLEINQSNDENFSNLSKLIDSTFITGGKYLLSDVKIKLKELYDKSNYLASPKATDIENYFEVRKFQSTNKETGKRDYYYEILKKKD